MDHNSYVSGLGLHGLPYSGVVVAFQKRKKNFLAYTMHDFANTTADVIHLIQTDIEDNRRFVNWNKLVLDLLMDKILNTSRCFHIPDHKQNISNLVAHMRQIVPNPPPDNWSPGIGFNFYSSDGIHVSLW